MGMDVTDLINYLRLEGPCDEDLLPTTTEEDPPPWEMSLPMREKLLIRGRTPRRNLVRMSKLRRRKTLNKRKTLRSILWKRTLRKNLVSMRTDHQKKRTPKRALKKALRKTRLRKGWSSQKKTISRRNLLV